MPVRPAGRAPTVIMTVYNEARTIEESLEALARGTLLPEEIIIVDGGSTDGTRDKVAAFSARHPEVPVRLILSPGANISRGRNIAIGAARTEVVAGTDAGTLADPRWLERIHAPFLADPPADVVGGNFRPLVVNAFQRATLPLHERPTATIAQSPSSRSIALRKSVWSAIGGYPEHLLTAEDTLFNDRWRAAGYRYVFAEDAIVLRRAQTDARSLLTRGWRYGLGEGQAGLHAVQRLLPLAFVLALAGCLAAAPFAPVLLAGLPILIAALVAHHALRKRLPGRIPDAIVYVLLHLAIGLVSSVAYLRGSADRLFWAATGRRPPVSPQTSLFDTDHEA